MNKAPRRIEVEEALSQVSEAARACNPSPCSHSERFYLDRVKKLDDFISPAFRELAEAGLLVITVTMSPVLYDDSYRSLREMHEEMKDKPIRRSPYCPCVDFEEMRLRLRADRVSQQDCCRNMDK